MAPATASPRYAAMARAFERAKAERLIAYPNADGSWSVKSYMLIVTGPAADSVHCSCIVGTRGLICKHAVCVTFCRKYGLRPIRPVTRAYEGAEKVLAAAFN